MGTVTMPTWMFMLMLAGHLLIPFMWLAATKSTVARLRRRGRLRE